MITYKDFNINLWVEGTTSEDGNTYTYMEVIDDIAWVNTYEIIEQVEAHDSTYLLEKYKSTNPNGGSISYLFIECITYEGERMVPKHVSIQAYQCTEYMELLKEYPDAPAEWLNALGNIR